MTLTDLVGLLEQAQVWTHAFVIGELACGNLAQRAKFLSLLAGLPQVPMASHDVRRWRSSRLTV